MNQRNFRAGRLALLFFIYTVLFAISGYGAWLVAKVEPQHDIRLVYIFMFGSIPFWLGFWLVALTTKRPLAGTGESELKINELSRPALLFDTLLFYAFFDFYLLVLKSGFSKNLQYIIVLFGFCLCMLLHFLELNCRLAKRRNGIKNEPPSK
jgi:hypothetical protein